jgi:predicted amidophosphoribosyltransferase
MYGILKRALAGALAALRDVHELLLPAVCAGCGTPAKAALCARCAEPPSDPLPPPPRPLSAWHAGVSYEGAAADWIRRFKYPAAGYRGLDASADGVAIEWAQRAARAAGAPPDVVVPIALHPRRLRERGFSPPAVLARALARAAGAPCAPSALVRTRDTARQTGLSRGARQRNVAQAFAARGPLPPRVWLVDDVATTGATLAAAARALRGAGAREIVAIVAAHRPLAARVESARVPGYKTRPSSPRRIAMASFKQALTLKHQSNLSEDVETVEFAAGDEVTVLKQWGSRTLVKSEDGKLFNVPKDALQG